METEPFDLAEREEEEIPDPEEGESAPDIAWMFSALSKRWTAAREIIAKDAQGRYLLPEEMKRLLALRQETLLAFWEAQGKGELTAYRQFWGTFYQLVGAKNENLFYGLRSGMLAEFATAYCFKKAGFRVFQPHIEEDQFQQIDLWVTDPDGSNPRAIQIKALTDNATATVHRAQTDKGYPVLYVSAPGVSASGDDVDFSDKPLINPVTGIPAKELLGAFTHELQNLNKGEKHGKTLPTAA